jgi:hypothetical protein
MSTKETLTTVSTTYARIAVLLLAFNMLLTGYAVYALNMSESSLEDANPKELSSDVTEEVTTE